MSYAEGIKKWGFYYIFVASALLMFLVKRWMMKRMEKHMAFMEEQKKNQK
jgi:preprotein translocase subunit YajC